MKRFLLAGVVLLAVVCNGAQGDRSDVTPFGPTIEILSESREGAQLTDWQFLTLDMFAPFDGQFNWNGISFPLSTFSGKTNSVTDSAGRLHEIVPTADVRGISYRITSDGELISVSNFVFKPWMPYMETLQHVEYLQSPKLAIDDNDNLFCYGYCGDLSNSKQEIFAYWGVGTPRIIPEPSTLALLCISVASLFAYSRRRR